MTKTKHKTLGAKILNIILTCVLVFLLAFLLVNAIMSIINPDHVFDIFGYQFYTVVTDSMDPTLPVGSLVIAKKMNSKTVLKDGDIVTFNAQSQHNGTKITVTHYFRKIIEHSDGRVQFETYPEDYKDTDNNDGYFVEKSDIRGVYVTHLPWVGKLTMFLKSPIAICMYLLIAVILLVGGFFMKKNKISTDMNK